MLISSAFYQTAQTPAKPDCSETAVCLSTAVCCTSLCRENSQKLTNIIASRDFPQKCVCGVCLEHLGWFAPTFLVDVWVYIELKYCWIRLTVAWSLPLLFMARNRLLKTPRIPMTPWDTAKSSSTPKDWEKHIDCSDHWWPLCPKSQRSNNGCVHTAAEYSCNSCLEWYIQLCLVIIIIKESDKRIL